MGNKLEFEYTAKRGIDYEYTPIVATGVNDGGRYTPIDNLLKNSGFDNDANWTLGNGWSIANGIATGINVSATYLQQTVTFDKTGIYVLSADVVEILTGVISFYGSAVTATTSWITSTYQVSTAGHFERYLQVTGTGTFTVTCRADNNSAGSVDNLNLYYLNDETIGSDGTTNLVTNGDFPTDTTGWTVGQSSGTAVISSVSGQLKVDNNSSATFGYAYQTITTEVGQAYELSVDILSSTYISNMRALRADNTTTICSRTETSADTYKVYFVALDTTTNIRVMCYETNTAAYVTFDNITVCASNNLITQGDFGADLGWTKETGWTISGGTLNVSSPGSTTSTYQSVTIPAPGTYEFSAEITSWTAGTLSLTTTAGTAIYTTESTPTLATTGWLRRKYYVHAAGTIFLKITGTSTAVASIDNVSCWLIEDDASTSNDNGFEIHGELYREAVAPGSDLRCLTNISVYNYLEQPYTSALDLQIFTYSAWVKLTSTSTQFIFARYDSAATGGGVVQLYNDSAVGVRALISDDSLATYDYVTAGTSYRDSIWHKYDFVCDSTNIYIYVDGGLIDYTAISAASGSLSNTSAVLKIGGRADVTVYPFLGNITNLQIYNSALTTAQIQNLYNTEKEQFREFSAFQKVGDTYTLQTTANSKKARHHREKTRNVALDGTPESNLIRDDTFHEIQTDLIYYQDLPQWRELLYSLGSDETFNCRIGSGFVPNDQITASLDYVDVEETRISEMIYHRFNLTIRER